YAMYILRDSDIRRSCSYLVTIIPSPCLFDERLISFFFFLGHADPQPLHSFPTRRSSDLIEPHINLHPADARRWRLKVASGQLARDRKSTRLNSSHVEISYAVFCLKKKNNINLYLSGQS